MSDYTPIIEQVAKILNITTELAQQLLENYPNFLREYQFYQVFSLLSSVSMVFLTGFGTLFLTYLILNSDEIKEVVKTFFFKMSCSILITSLVVSIVSKILIIIYSPNIHFIMEYLKSK